MTLTSDRTVTAKHGVRRQQSSPDLMQLERASMAEGFTKNGAPKEPETGHVRDVRDTETPGEPLFTFY